jgi:hypothetical protein
MPWLTGNERHAGVVETSPEGLRLHDLLSGSLYAGFLSQGFSTALAAGGFRPERPALAFRAGWTAVAVSARSSQRRAKAHLGPFLAPTAARPHAGAPLGFALFSSQWLLARLGERAGERLPDLQWALRLNALLGPGQPVFCDPVLELELSQRPREERRLCTFGPASAWGRVLLAFDALYHQSFDAPAAQR